MSLVEAMVLERLLERPAASLSELMDAALPSLAELPAPMRSERLEQALLQLRQLRLLPEENSDHVRR